MTRAMTKVLIAHPGLRDGGSELSVLWSVAALHESCRVSIATGCPIDLARLNRHCGTGIAPNDMQTLLAPQWPRWAIGHTDAVRGALFARFLRSAASPFDICISGYNRMDFGKPAIHFLLDFSCDDDLRRRYDPIPTGSKGLFHRAGILRNGYLAATRAIAGTSDFNGSGDWLIAPSEWTAGVFATQRGLRIKRVVYPPVADAAPTVAWEQREYGFVIVGRVSHEKRIAGMIDVLARVRAAGHDVHLHIVGTIGDDECGRVIRDRIARNRTWCSAVGYLAGAEKAAFLARHRFALHARSGEAFGIAVAEYIKAGCIAFVPRQGGPAEIVGADELIYQDDDEAAAKIIRLLDNPARQHALHAQLARRGTLFSSERFVTEVRGLVADWLRRDDEGGMGSGHAH